ncbi:GMC oxidoreductase [Streptomyces viridosporus]|uniref:GMC oxidoreductase n=1 Tax=Streptomyces viridosporus TaxID=67581 RepID=UPI001FCAD694|nr:GMC oxidoreductase [Streptomyces viridosporus]
MRGAATGGSGRVPPVTTARTGGAGAAWAGPRPVWTSPRRCRTARSGPAVGQAPGARPTAGPAQRIAGAVPLSAGPAEAAPRTRSADAQGSTGVRAHGGERGSRFRSFPGHRPEGLRSIDYGYLGGREDHRRPREGVRVTAAPLEGPPCAGPARGLLGPGPELLDDDRPLDRWIREHLGTAQHTCGTVPRGPVDGPEHTAVDQFGRVHGVRGPRVADTSVPPRHAAPGARGDRRPHR